MDTWCTARALTGTSLALVAAPVQRRLPVRLLLVSLHHALVAHGRVGRVLTGVLARPALAQEVPALVETDLELAQPLSVLVAHRARARGMGTEPVLLLDQLVDPADHVVIVHVASMPRGQASASSPGPAGTNFGPWPGSNRPNSRSQRRPPPPRPPCVPRGSR